LGDSVYHLELRQFPHNMCHFNMSGEELHATVLGPWAADRWIELGERKWDPRRARLTVLEGPRVPPEQLSMGRGWRAAQRVSRDVTEQLLAQAEAQSRPAPADLVADSLGLELLSRLGSDPAPLRRAWELAAARNPEGPASATLAIAERAVASLLRARLVVLLRAGAPDAAAEVPAPPAPAGAVLRAMSESESEHALGLVESWTGEEQATPIMLRRA
jgi:hypothetical protein